MKRKGFTLVEYQLLLSYQILLQQYKEDVTKKDVTKPCTPAKLTKSGDVIRLNPRMDIKTTVTAVKSGASVMCDDQASALAVAINFNGFIGPEIDKYQKPGYTYYDHYHPDRYSHRHIWYYN